MSNKHEFTGSSSLIHADYFEDKNTMEIKFVNGNAIYHYPDCHKSHFDALIAAKSPGSHFHQNIRNKIPGTKVG